jgi:predicted  nucleic acid-binding Zn-ribbon protein
MPEKTLRELQEIDRRIAEGEDRIRAFDPKLAEVDGPALQLEQEVSTTRARLREMKVDERRIELAADEKRQRVKKLQERLNQIRNVREEAAVSVEIDLLRRSLDGEEQEALTLIDQIRRLEIRLSEQERALEQARAELEPRREELLREKADAERELAELREQRQSRASGLQPKQLRIYEGIRGTGRRQAVSELTLDGACSNCYSVIPLQLQNEVRRGGALVRCEACGVILTMPHQDQEA